MSRIEALKNMLKDAPEDDFLQHALALELIKIDNDDEAQVLFECILNRNPKYVGSYYHLGKLLERANKYDEAIEIYAQGMNYAKELDDKHSYNELMMAKDEIDE